MAGWNNVLPVQTVFEREPGALEVLLRMLWADSRSETSPQRVGCGPARDYSGRIVHSARQRAGGRARVSPLRKQAFWLASSRFAQKKGAILRALALLSAERSEEKKTKGALSDPQRGDFIPAGARHFFSSRASPHRRWVQETQPHTYECAGRISTAEFQTCQ